MRKAIQEELSQENNYKYKIIAIDDERGKLDSLSIFLKRTNYDFIGITDPIEGIERIKKEHFDLLLLDFMMTPLHGDDVVQEIRKFNKELYILLLTGHKDLAPPLETIRRLDIQGYCEKSDKFEQLLLLIESGIKSISQMKEIKKINEQLKESKDELEKAYLDMIQSLRYAVEAKDPYTRGHSDRVSEFAVLIGRKLGLPDNEIRTLQIGGLFHDIGKIGVPDNILQKEAKLTDDEYSQIDIIPIVKHHHERFDGNGYPSKLKGEEIPFLARITAVADSFDAMTSKRSYRGALDIQFVKEEIERCKGTQFDPNIANAFLEILNKEYYKIEEVQTKFPNNF